MRMSPKVALALVSAPTVIHTVAESDLDDLLPLFRAYCEFYETDPLDEDLLALSRALVADPEREGIQLLARDLRGRGIGFATVYWLWSSTRGKRIGLMNDLFVAEHARGSGVAEALIDACRAECARRAMPSLQWKTALDNHRAQAVYDRVGGVRSQWLDYDLPVHP
jgi:GNAT superfamily N-acetyltransferase